MHRCQRRTTARCCCRWSRNEFLQFTEERELIVGLAGERLLNSFKFYAVFKDSEDYTVRCESDEIGTITTPPPVGDRFALAGRVWEVEELDIPRKLIYVKQVPGKMEISWPGDYGEINTRILKRMRQVLAEETVYPYLKENARQRLEVAPPAGGQYRDAPAFDGASGGLLMVPFPLAWNPLLPHTAEVYRGQRKAIPHLEHRI